MGQQGQDAGAGSRLHPPAATSTAPSVSWVTVKPGDKTSPAVDLDAGVLSPKEHTEEGLKWMPCVLKPLLSGAVGGAGTSLAAAAAAAEGEACPSQGLEIIFSS